MKRKYRILEHTVGERKTYSVQVQKLWGLYWGIPRTEWLSRLNTYLGIGYFTYYFNKLSEAEFALNVYLKSEVNTIKVVKVIS